MPGRTPIDDERLLEAALEEFSARSFDEASVNTIIRNAGVSKGSFYYRFETKYDLYLFLLRQGVEKKWEYISSRVASPPSGDIFGEFLDQAKAGTEFAAEHPLHHRLARMFSREKGTPVYERALRDLGIGDVSGLEARIDSAVAAGDIRSDLTSSVVKRILSHMLARFDEIMFPDSTWDITEANRLLEEFVEVIRHGVAAKK